MFIYFLNQSIPNVALKISKMWNRRIGLQNKKTSSTTERGRTMHPAIIKNLRVETTSKLGALKY